MKLSQNSSYTKSSKKVPTFIWVVLGIIFMAGIGYATTTINENSVTTTGNVTGNVNNALNVFNYGAVGDGVTDDSTAFQLAIDTAGDTGEVYAPAGYTYNISRQINSSYNYLKIRVEGLILLNNNPFLVLGSSNDPALGNEIYVNRIYANSRIVGNNNIAIKVLYGRFNNININSMQNLNYGLLVNSTYGNSNDNRFYFDELRNSTYGIYINGNDAVNVSEGWMIHGGFIVSCQSRCVYLGERARFTYLELKTHNIDYSSTNEVEVNGSDNYLNILYNSLPIIGANLSDNNYLDTRNRMFSGTFNINLTASGSGGDINGLDELAGYDDPFNKIIYLSNGISFRANNGSGTATQYIFLGEDTQDIEILKTLDLNSQTLKNVNVLTVNQIRPVSGTNVQIGAGTAQNNITMTSPDGTEYNCGVANGGAFSCS